MEESLTKIQKRDNKWIPWYFVAFFGLIFTTNAIFVTLATSTHRGVVTENAYQKGVDYNQSIAALERQVKLGWQGDITLDNNELSFILKDKESTLIENADVTAYLMKITQAGEDFTTPLAYGNNGTYINTINFPSKGQWNITVAVKWQGKHHQQSTRVNIK